MSMYPEVDPKQGQIKGHIKYEEKLKNLFWWKILVYF